MKTRLERGTGSPAQSCHVAERQSGADAFPLDEPGGTMTPTIFEVTHQEAIEINDPFPRLETGVRIWDGNTTEDPEES